MNDDINFKIRGLQGILVSRALQFLDMLQQGHADIGKITDSQKPKVAADSMGIAYGAVLTVLARIDPDLKKSFSSILREKLRPEVSTSVVWFIRITVFGSIFGIIVLVLIDLLGSFRILPLEIAIPITLVGFTIVVILVLSITIYAFKNQGKDPPQNVIDAISELPVRFEAERAFQTIVEFVREETPHPLPILVIGDYDDFEYTGEVFTTSRGLTVRLANIPPTHWNNGFSLESME